MYAFSDAVHKFVVKSKSRGETVMRKLALDMFASVVKRTPVDTGRARGSWNVEINRVDKGTGFDTGTMGAPPAPEHQAMAASKALAAKWGDEIYISNNLPYIIALEEGHSQQSRAMVSLTVYEAKVALNKILEQEKFK